MSISSRSAVWSMYWRTFNGSKQRCDRRDIGGLTPLSGAIAIGNSPSCVFLSDSAPALSKTIAASPCPSQIAKKKTCQTRLRDFDAGPMDSRSYPKMYCSPWCNAVKPLMSDEFRGLLLDNISSIRGTLPIAAARCSGNCPCLSLTRVEAPWEIKARAVVSWALDTVRCNAVYTTTSSVSFNQRRHGGLDVNKDDAE